MNPKLKVGGAFLAAGVLHLGVLALGGPTAPSLPPEMTQAQRPGTVRVTPEPVRPGHPKVTRPAKAPTPVPVATLAGGATSASSEVAVEPEALGSPGTLGSPESSKASVPSYEAYLARVRQAIADHRSYPYQSRVRRESGTVVVGFSLLADGSLQGPVEVETSSGFSRLDVAARSAVVEAAPFPAPPPGVPQARVTLPIVFVLE